MSITNQNAKAVQLQALEMAREYIENNQEIPNEISHILFPPEKREYELTYWGKESREQILSETIPVPLQENRIFPPNATVNSNEWINKLIFGENLQILKTLIQMKKDGKLKNADGTDGVRLIYIDPPFATKQEFKVNGEEQVAYADKLSGSEFIEFIRKRLILAKELLSNDGVIFVHLDQKMVHYIKVIMDEIFGKNNFRNEIIWKYFGPTSTDKNFPRKHDIILFYSKSSDYYFDSNATLINYDEKAIKRYDKVDENGKRYKIYKNKDGSERIAYMKQGKPTEVFEIPFVQGTSNERIGYPTQKPEKLLEILIKAVTKHGDLVMDFFAGSGTTPAVAEKLGRRWIAVDVGKYSIYTIQKRLLQINNIRPFMLYSGGLYDAEKLNKFDNENWKLFALQLWNCQVVKNTIRGLEFDGEKDNCLVKVYSPQELKKDNMKISYETISEIDVILGGNVGNEIFIIAPQGQFTFAEDEVEIKDRLYHILRVPYSMLAKFTENFTPPKQPRDIDSVNEIVDSVGFDFIQPPQVDFKIVKNTKTKESQLKKSIKIKTINKKAMFIFIDNAGNEKRVVIDGTK